MVVCMCVCLVVVFNDGVLWYTSAVMPELPEVETVRLQLLDKVVGKEVRAVEVFHEKTVAGGEALVERLPGRIIEHIDRVGKLLIFSFVGEDDLFLLAHLKMTGQFFFVDGGDIITGGGHSMTTSDIAEFPGRHTRVALYFTDGSALYFNDMRLFGYVRLVNKTAMEHARAGFGPEPIATDFDCAWFVAALRRKKTSVKAALLNQAFVAGLGNIYVDEALWMVGVRPTRRADKVTKDEAARLCLAAGDVMRASIALGGTTFRSFVDTGGTYGNFRDQLNVFGKEGESCPRCGEVIVKIRHAGRGTHYCPGCQK